MKIKLAEALLRRKELQGKVDILQQIKDKDLFEIKAKRQPISESIDDIVTAEFDWHARQLRLIDATIQQANWVTEVEVTDIVIGTFVAK